VRAGLRYQRGALQAGGEVIVVASKQDRVFGEEMKDFVPEMGRHFKIVYAISF
jgi:hypothetical protein